MVAQGKPKEASTRKVAKPTKLRASIKPGTVLILLSGHFRGKRVVFLKQLPSGLLLVTGPFGVNGVPLRRVNQRYVIATSTKVDVSKANVGKFEDTYFAQKKEKAKKSSADSFFAKSESKTPLTDAKKADQKAVDAALMATIGKDAMLKKYLKSRFSLSNGMKPHEMTF